ncbi:MAG: cytidylyltransferase domain-containing protein [bacterium]
MKHIGDTIAFIPVRGGSKSIVNKNIKIINGQPLVYWVLDAAINSFGIDKVVVSTDSERISRIVTKYNSKKVLTIGRSKKVSTDEASTESVMLEFAEKYNFNDIILIQATSPLLDKEDLNLGIKKYQNQNIDSVLSVVRQKRFIWDKYNSSYKPVNYNYENRPRRQDFDGFLVENGAFYITSRKRLLKHQNRISGKIGIVEMDETSYFEIDEPSDWIIVENLLKNKYGSKNKKINLNNIKCLISDCDGVLTDGGMYYSEKGDELKKFNTKDGKAFELLKTNGYITGIITGENMNLVEQRAKKLNVDEVHMGIKNKLKIINSICNKYELNYDNIAYIGDDLNDKEVLENIGFSCSVKNAVEEIKKVSDYITNVQGGDGAVREIAQLIISNQGKE